MFVKSNLVGAGSSAGCMRIVWTLHNVYIVQFFSSRPSEVRLILKSPKCCTIQHKFVPARSVERNIEKIRFPWASNSKFVIFSQIFPRSNYKICPIIPRLFPVSNGDSPVSTTFPRSNYRGFFTTGESYCTMYTLCSVRMMSVFNLNKNVMRKKGLEIEADVKQTRIESNCDCIQISGKHVKNVVNFCANSHLLHCI